MHTLTEEKKRKREEKLHANTMYKLQKDTREIEIETEKNICLHHISREQKDERRKKKEREKIIHTMMSNLLIESNLCINFEFTVLYYIYILDLLQILHAKRHLDNEHKKQRTDR